MRSERATYAARAYSRGRARRTALGAVERAADGVLAAGGLFLANASMSLGLGLPDGTVGTTLGFSLLGAGIAWMSRHRRGRIARPQHEASIALSAPQPRLAAATPLRRAAA
jgi:hypothetical protein